MLQLFICRLFILLQNSCFNPPDRDCTPTNVLLLSQEKDNECVLYSYPHWLKIHQNQYFCFVSRKINPSIIDTCVDITILCCSWLTMLPVHSVIFPSDSRRWFSSSSTKTPDTDPLPGLLCKSVILGKFRKL